MAVTVHCTCGVLYHLKDQYAGMLLECPACEAHIRAPEKEASPFFDRDIFLLREKHFSISEKYYVWDDEGHKLLFVRRPSLWLVRLCLFLFVWFWAAAVLKASAGFVAAWLITAFVIRPKRNVTFYANDSEKVRLLTILQDKYIQFPVASYTLQDNAGHILGTFKKNALSDFLRKRWSFYLPDGRRLLTAREDSIILSLLRRLTGFFIDLAIFRTNFVIYDGNGEQVLGEFNRKMSLFDRYTLDMSEDYDRLIDRRIALALGVMLDTGEGR